MAADGMRQTVMRVFRLWRLYGTMDLLWMLRDARSLALFVASDAIVSVASVTGMLLLAERFNGIGPWSKSQIIFMLGYAMLVTGLPSVLFNYNVAFISRRVGRGQLDHTLIQPQPLWMAFLTEGFSPFSAIMEIVPGLALLSWALGRVGVTATPGWMALLTLNLLSSMTIALSFSFVLGSLAFWAPRAAEEVNSASWKVIDQIKSFPLDSVGTVVGGGLLSIVPVGFVAWYPCRALLGIDRSAAGSVVTPLAALLFATLAALVFRKGLQQYGRTGSQRYLSFGHRR